jgi:hypothetical protein
MIQFLNPWLIAGAALAGIPILIHLFDKRKLPMQILPTLRFLHQINEQVKRRIRLRDALLLALRVLAIALLALLVARPVWTEGESAPRAVTGNRDTIFVLDSSFGMHYKSTGKTLFSIARERLADDVKALQPGEEAALMTCDQQWKIISDGFQPGDAVLRGVKDLQPGDAPGNWPECVRGAISLAGKSRNANVEIRLLTNLAAKGWDGEPLPQAPTGKHITLNVVDVAGKDLPNRAVTGLDVAHKFGNGGEEWAAVIQAANYGDAVNALPVQIKSDGGAVMAQGLLDWDGPGLREKTLTLKPGAEEFVSGVVAMEPDSLPQDDERPFQFYFGKPVGVLIVDGSPGTLAEESESYYALTALRPGRSQGAVDPKVITRTALEPGDLKGMAVVMMLNVGELSASTVQLLEGFVKGGGGLFWAMGDRVTPESYAKLGDLVPGRIRSLRDLRGAGKAPVSLKSFPSKQPIFRELSSANLSTASFHVYEQLEQMPPAAEMLLEFADGSPALVEEGLGKGKVLWFASSLDDSWNNLPFRPFYLPLLQQSVRYLAGTLKPAMHRSYPLGAKVDLQPFSAGRTLSVRTPDGRMVAVNAKRAADPAIFADTDRAGLYRVLVNNTPVPDASFVILRPAEASDLTRSSPDRIQEKIRAAGFGGGVENAGEAGRRKMDPILPLLGLLALTLWGEAWVARRGSK